ncbi:MAG: hypothetical protein MZV70_68540 [Desulfobacterales bacterium]|nr:hypothetical protein [Desulfobacterales bacterium]
MNKVYQILPTGRKPPSCGRASNSTCSSAPSAPAVYFLLSYHVIFYGQEASVIQNVYFLKKAKLEPALHLFQPAPEEARSRHEDQAAARGRHRRAAGRSCGLLIEHGEKRGWKASTGLLSRRPRALRPNEAAHRFGTPSSMRPDARPCSRLGILSREPRSLRSAAQVAG